MEATIFFEESVDGSNGGYATTHLCAEGKVHLEHKCDGFDAYGDKDSAYNRESWRVLGPCDGSCKQEKMQLTALAETFVQRFVSSGGKDCGDWQEKKPYSPTVYTEKHGAYFGQ